MSHRSTSRPSAWTRQIATVMLKRSDGIRWKLVPDAQMNASRHAKTCMDSHDFATQNPRNTKSARCDFQPLLRRLGFHVIVNLTGSSIVILTNWGLAR